MNHAFLTLYDSKMHPQNYIKKTKFYLLSDRRILSYQEFGDLTGTPVFYSHTTAGSKVEGEFYQEAALKFGFRLICIDRPGIGDSCNLPKRKLLDYPKDVIELADELSILQFGLLGWAGGACYSFAMAYLFPKRILFCIAIASYRNFANYMDITTQMSSSLEKIIAINHQKHPKLLRIYLDLLSITVKALPNLSLRTKIFSDNQIDKVIIAKEAVKSVLFRSQKEAFKEGIYGPQADIMIHYSDWGFDLRELHVLVDLFHGKQDDVVPLSYSHFIQQSIPECKLKILSDQGHFFPCLCSHQIFSLAERRVSEQQASTRRNDNSLKRH